MLYFSGNKGIASLIEVTQRMDIFSWGAALWAGQPLQLPQWALLLGLLALLALALAVVLLSLRLRRCRKQLQQDRNYDLVTGLGSRDYFVGQFERALPQLSQERCCLAFLSFDIARANQYYGDRQAEEQLRFAAEQLLLDSRNRLTSRVSGGGIALLRPATDRASLGLWATELLQRLNRYPERYGEGFRPEFRLGLHLLQPGEKDCESALSSARQAYRYAMEVQRPYAFSFPEEMKLKNQSIEALYRREFRIDLQFIVRASDGSIAGAEALSRWDHPQKGLLYPGSYVGFMESDRTIAALDFYVFEEACKQLETWSQYPGLSLSCNFARVSIDNQDFLPRLQSIVEKYRFDHHRLVIEITEDTMEGNKETAFANVSRCKELGFRISLDDTGSGYTSFSDLRDYPIDIVKIDRSILQAAVEPRGVDLLGGMIALVHSLKMEALCEGVETPAQVELLRRLGCDYMQGYYYYRALPVEEAEQILQQR